MYFCLALNYLWWCICVSFIKKKNCKEPEPFNSFYKKRQRKLPSCLPAPIICWETVSSLLGSESLLLTCVIGKRLEWGWVKGWSGNTALVLWDCGLWTSGSRGAWAALSGCRGLDLPCPRQWSNHLYLVDGLPQACEQVIISGAAITQIPLLPSDPFNLSSRPRFWSSSLCWHTDF